jgi:hypothetical protein
MITTANVSSGDFKELMDRLLITLLPIAYTLDSRVGRKCLAHDLDEVRRRLNKGEITDKPFRELSELILNLATDIKIWNAVIALTITVSRIATEYSTTKLPVII